MTTRIALKAKSGAPLEGVLAEPTSNGSATAPTLVLLQEWWGVNDHIESLADRFAAEGFLTLAPDLYRGAIAKTADEAGKMMAALDWPRAMDDIAGAVAFLRAHPRGNGKVGVTGFCMGGALAFASACNVDGIDAVVPWYGVPSNADYTKITAPVLAHFAKHDSWAKPEYAFAIRDTLAAVGKPMELHVYDAQHAFANDTRPEVYDEAATKLAWERTVAFLRGKLA